MGKCWIPSGQVCQNENDLNDTAIWDSWASDPQGGFQQIMTKIPNPLLIVQVS